MHFKESYSLLLQSYSLLFTHVLFVFTLTHSCSTRSSFLTHVLLVFTLIHSCSARDHPYTLVFHSCSLVFIGVLLVFIGVLLVFIGVHWCSTYVHWCSLVFTGVRTFVFPFVWCFRLDPLIVNFIISITVHLPLRGCPVRCYFFNV